MLEPFSDLVPISIFASISLLPNRMISPNGFEIFHHALIKSMTCDRGAVADDDQLAAGAY